MSFTFGSPRFRQLELAEARLKLAQERLPAIRRDIREPLQVVWAQLEGIRTSRTWAELAQKNALTVLDGFKTQYLFGRRTALELLIVQNEVYQTAARVINLWYDQLLAQINLLGHIGLIESRLNATPVSGQHPATHWARCP